MFTSVDNPMPDTREQDAIKVAVKEALDDQKMLDLAKQLTALSTQVSAGFAAVHTRQDLANGKLMSHETKLATQSAKDSSAANWEKSYWFVITTLVGAVIYFFTKN